MPAQLTQSMQALDVANRVRVEGAAVQREVHAGVLSVSDALDDPRAQAMPVGRLLCAPRYWGPSKADRLCKRVGVWPARRVRDLTSRQRHVIREATR